MSKFRQVIALITGGIILAACLFLITPRHINIPPKDLSRYVPEQAVFAVRISRAEFSNPENLLLQRNPSLAGLIDQIDTHLSRLEKQLAQPVDQILWLATSQSGELLPTLLVKLKQKPARKQSGLFGRITYAQVSDLYSQLMSGSTQRRNSSTWQVKELSSLVYAFTFLDNGKEYFTRDSQLFAEKATMAAYIGNGAWSSITAQTAIGRVIIPARLRDDLDEVIAYLDWDNEQLNLQIHTDQKSINADLVDGPALLVPDDFDLMIVNQLNDYLSGYAGDPVTEKIERLTKQLADQYFLPVDTIVRNLKSISAVIMSGDKWLMAGRQSTDKLARQLAAGYGSEIKESKLSDGSDYKELIKKVQEPEVQQIDGWPVLVWSHPDLGAIYYLVESKQAAYLSNDLTLIRSQIKGSDVGIRLENHHRVKRCLKDLLDRSVPTQYILGSWSDNFNFSVIISEFSIYKLDIYPRKQVYSYCLS